MAALMEKSGNKEGTPFCENFAKWEPNQNGFFHPGKVLRLQSKTTHFHQGLIRGSVSTDHRIPNNPDKRQFI
jgi:hypothetical protein